MKVFILLIFVFLTNALTAAAQNSDRERGIELFNQKKYAEAIGFFDKSVKADDADITSFFYLGQSFENLGKKNEAAQNYTRCYQEGILFLEKTIFEAVGDGSSLSRKDEQIKNKLGDKIELALKSGERLQQIENNSAQNLFLQDALLIFKYFSVENQTNSLKAPENSENKKLKVTDKPSPKYTKQAMKNLTVGEVHLYVMFLANGRIGLVIPKILLSDGLTEETIKAARKLAFEPQTLNGKPVTVMKTVVYNFTY